MKKLIFILLFALSLKAHFLTLIPQSDYIEDQNQSSLSFTMAFMHPFEQTGMTLVKPEFYEAGNKKPLNLHSVQLLNHQAWQSKLDIKKPGVYSFYVKPQPYFEKSEAKYISHVPKVMISAYGREDGWEEPLGLDYEIVPLTKPFGLYQGNLFQGKVLRHGKAVSNVEVEVELYNTYGLKAPTSAHVTQVIKTNEDGVFSFVMNHKGWWGFAALIVEGEKVHDDGMMYPIENGSLLWIKAY